MHVRARISHETHISTECFKLKLELLINDFFIDYDRFYIGSSNAYELYIGLFCYNNIILIFFICSILNMK